MSSYQKLNVIDGKPTILFVEEVSLNDELEDQQKHELHPSKRFLGHAHDANTKCYSSCKVPPLYQGNKNTVLDKYTLEMKE